LDEEENNKDDNKSFMNIAGDWVHNVFQRGNKTEIEMVRPELSNLPFFGLMAFNTACTYLLPMKFKCPCKCMSCCRVSEAVQSRGTQESCRDIQIVKKHDVDSAVKILFKNAGPQFQDHTVKWGAVHADERRSVPLSCFL